MTAQPGGWADDAHRYRLDSRIATGGMGEVWRATDTTLGRPVAVKVLKQEYADDETFRTRFASEAQHAAALHHPGVAAVYDFGEAVGDGAGATPRPFLVMELVDGEPLSALLRPGHPLDPEVARDLMAQAADAIGAAHTAGIVHRDVKPGNLIITPDRRVKITDFGIARATEGMALTQTGQVMGTPQYLSPEQASGGRATPASDVYSLGVVTFECLAGRRPFVGETPVATALAHLREPVPPLPDDVPADLAGIVTRAMAKDPGDRFPDAHAFAAALRDPATVPIVPPAPPGPADTRVLTGAGPIPPASETLATPVEPPRRRRELPWAWLLLGLAVLAAVIALIALAATTDDDDPASGPREPRQTQRTEPPTEESPSETVEESPTETEPETFSIDEDDYVGRPFPDVEQELKELGLKVEKEELDNDGTHEAETVADVSPTTDLTEGDTVTVSVWGNPEAGGPPEDPGNGNGNGHGNGNGNGEGNG